MSFAEYHDNVLEHDVVIIHVGFNNMVPLKVKAGSISQTKYGAIKHGELIGKRFGTKIQCSKGWVYILYPTPELWTRTLPHRTQILYSPDISLIIFNLELKPGSIVAESGTGSGSLTHALVRSVMPRGHVHTFEFHQERADKAREDFISHDLGQNVTVVHRDACVDGFQLNHVVDAVFLDLPQPWDAIESAAMAIKLTGGRICSFSPCIEQVQRTCGKLRELGFEDVEIVECVQTTLGVRSCSMPRANLGDDTSSATGKRRTTESDGRKYLKLCDTGACITSEDTHSHTMAVDSDVANERDRSGRNKGARRVDDFVYNSGIPPTSMLGHTGFLTFATLYDQRV